MSTAMSAAERCKKCRNGWNTSRWMAFLRWLIFAEKMAMKMRGNEILWRRKRKLGLRRHMRPEYYADLYRRYQTHVRQYGDKNLQSCWRSECRRLSLDRNADENAHWLMDGLSLHYYVHPQGWEEKERLGI